MKIKSVPFRQYYREAKPKKQIYLHHTAGGPKAEPVFAGWDKTTTKIATCVVIGHDGVIVQGFGSEFWGYHLGLKNDIFKANGIPYQQLDKISIGIELCNWGGLTKKGGKFYHYLGKEVPADEVVELDKPHRGYKYVHAYSDAQIESVIQLLKLWNEKYGIDISYNEDIWDITPRALKGESGVFTHCSVRKDKIDVTPQPKLIEALKSL